MKQHQFVVSAFIAMATVLLGFTACQKEDEHTPQNPSAQDSTPVTPLPVVLPDGALPGLFSVSDSSCVRFSKGNLQYSRMGTHTVLGNQTLAGTWRFAPEQYTVVGTGNSSIFYESDTNFFDLFGWGTSGYEGCFPTQYLQDDAYGTGTGSDLLGKYANYDWGVYNAISNGGNEPGLWRLLSKDEWRHLLTVREGADDKKGYATVCDICGLILLPDDWSLPEGCTFSANTADGFNTNVYNADTWALMQKAGAVLLPATGFRKVGYLYSENQEAYYWSSTASGAAAAYCCQFRAGTVTYFGYGASFRGNATRLVMDAKPQK